MHYFRQVDFVTVQDRKLTANGSPTQILTMMSVKTVVLSLYKNCTRGVYTLKEDILRFSHSGDAFAQVVQRYCDTTIKGM